MSATRRGIERSFWWYLVAGGLATGSHYALTIVAIERFSINALAASSAGFAVGATVKYLLNYFMAFRSAERHVEALPRFAATLGLLFCANGALFWLLHDLAGLHYLVAQVTTTTLLVPIGYVLSRNWVFRRC